LNPWKDLLSKIFPGAETNTAPEEILIPEDKPENPVERIHAMRKIRGNNGFARLYGAKDLEQFARQAEYMRDFGDAYPKEIPFGDSMPTYADMSLAQLRCYFTWRTLLRQGKWRDTPYSYVLLYIFELLNTHDEPEKNMARLAECWLEMSDYYSKLDAKMPQWMKDYYACHELGLPFGELMADLGLEEFFPEPPRRSGLLSLSSYRAQDSRFFREHPDCIPVLEKALEAAVNDLAPLFTLHGVNEEETFFMKPARFSFHELYRGAAAQPPPIYGNREVRISRSEIVRLRGGGWSRALEDAFRPPSHAVGYAAKRLEGELRRLADFTAPWNDPEGNSLLERWMQAEPAAFPLTEDPRLPAILAETARAAFAPGSPAPVTEALARELEQEPLRSILALRGISGFVKQGKKLTPLEDDYPEAAHCGSTYPDYAGITHAQLRTYLTWRTKLRKGIVLRTDTAYALLYIRELESGIGTKEPLRDLCRFLRAYAPLDKNIARVLPAKIEALAKAKQANLSALLAEEGVQAWFPALFMFGACAQLPIFDQLAAYQLSKSKFYRPGLSSLFGACFDCVLRAAEDAFRQAGLNLRHIMLTSPHAPALAGFFLKRMEQRLRERAHYPYAVKADPAQMLAHALKGHPAQRVSGKLRAFLASGALTSAIDAAVEEFAQANDLSVLASKRQEARGKKQETLPPAPPPPPPEVKIDFALLPKIRAQADKMTEMLIVEEENEAVGAARTPPTLSPATHSGGKNATPTSLYEALTPAQIAIIEYLCTGEGIPPAFDEIAVEGINEIALEVFGDTLIETDRDGRPRVIEEYVESWKEM